VGTKQVHPGEALGGRGWPLINGGALEHGGQATRARAHGGCGGGSRCLYCSGRYLGGWVREERSWLELTEAAVCDETIVGGPVVLL